MIGPPNRYVTYFLESAGAGETASHPGSTLSVQLQCMMYMVIWSQPVPVTEGAYTRTLGRNKQTNTNYSKQIFKFIFPPHLAIQISVFSSWVRLVKLEFWWLYIYVYIDIR